MTNLEFSLEFDILWNNIMSNQAPGLNSYEKSVFLTQGQEAIVIGLYTGKIGESFESTEASTDYISNLVKQVTITESESESENLNGLDPRSKFFKIPEDVWFKTGEIAIIEDDSLTCNQSSEREADVIPVTQDTLYRTKNSPFRGPNNRRVLRLTYSDNLIELISKYNIKSYTVRYLTQPSPIILETLPDGLTINGESQEQECKLNPAIHRAILEKAVSIAKAVWQQNN